MLTSNQLNKVFSDFFDNHAQINTVIVADDFDFAAYPDILYPVVNIQAVNTSTRGNEIVSKYKFIIGDIEDTNSQNSENEIWNDCELIAGDVLTYFGDDDYEPFLMDTDSVMIRFSEGQTDRTAGIVFTAVVRQTRDINPCTIPTKDNISDDDSPFDDEFSDEFI